MPTTIVAIIPGEIPLLLLLKVGHPTSEKNTLTISPVEESSVDANSVVCKELMRAAVAVGVLVTAV